MLVRCKVGKLRRLEARPFCCMSVVFSTKISSQYIELVSSNVGWLFLGVYHDSRAVTGIDRKLGAWRFIWAITVTAPMCSGLEQQRQKLDNLLHFRLFKPTRISALSCALQLSIYKDPLVADGIRWTLIVRAFIWTIPMLIWRRGRALIRTQSVAILEVCIFCAFSAYVIRIPTESCISSWLPTWWPLIAMLHTVVLGPPNTKKSNASNRFLMRVSCKSYSPNPTDVSDREEYLSIADLFCTTVSNEAPRIS